MKRRGRPILGVISGLFFGIFLAVDLLIFKVRTLDTMSVIGLPALGVVLGIVLAMWAPLGGRAAASPPPPPAASDAT